MQALYHLPLDAFETYCPTGSPADIAAALAAYAVAGSRTFTITAAGPDPSTARLPFSPNG